MSCERLVDNIESRAESRTRTILSKSVSTWSIVSCVNCGTGAILPWRMMKVGYTAGRLRNRFEADRDCACVLLSSSKMRDHELLYKYKFTHLLLLSLFGEAGDNAELRFPASPIETDKAN